MVNVSAPDVPPPGVGVNTVTEAVPAVAMSPAGTAAVNCVALPKVVTNAAPFHCTTELLTKFVPVTVSVKPAPPAVAEEGDSEEAVGTGLEAARIVNVSEPTPSTVVSGWGVASAGTLPADNVVSRTTVT